jgi:hypothetical protein
VFLLPFLAIGIVILISWIVATLTVLSPAPIITIDRGLVEPGQTIEIAWQIRSGIGWVQRLRLRLIGREQASYERGTTTITDKEPFHEHALLDVTDPFEITQGSIRFTVPTETMHTFKSKNNAIGWWLVVDCEVAFWFGTSDEYELIIVPPGVMAMLAN